MAGTLRASRGLAGHRIEIQARDGVVTLTGELETPAQKAEALARTRYVAGVRSVVDQLRVSQDRSIRTVQYQSNPAQYQPNPALAYGASRNGDQFGGDIIYGGGGGAPMNGGMTNGGMSNGGMINGGPISGGPISDGGPVPEGPAGMAVRDTGRSARLP